MAASCQLMHGAHLLLWGFMAERFTLVTLKRTVVVFTESTVLFKRQLLLTAASVSVETIFPMQSHVPLP